MLSSLLVWLQGCAIGTPWPRLSIPSHEQAQETLVLVLTHVVVDTQQRREFDRQNSRVLASMGSHPGLIGYAARRQLFGDQGWTMSVWASDEARAAFVRSAVHREAIARSMPALRTVELKRLTVARKDLPTDWDQVLRMLADPEGRRNYWE
jgi:heme-degrading monooxygenase HmoA